MGQKKELILHIGRAKSGTSTLQRYLTAQRAALAERGICYPEAGTGGRFAHHDIAHLCQGISPFPQSLKLIREQFEAEVAPFDRVIVSSEAFQNLILTHNLTYFFSGDQGAMESLAGWSLPPLRTRPYNITVLCYIREFLEFACSSYAQRVHATAYGGSLEAYCHRHFRRSLKSLFRLWRGYADTAQFLYYERSHLKDRDIIADFFSHVGVAPPEAPPGKDANPSISGNLLAFKVLLNRRGGQEQGLYNVFSRIARLEPRYRGKIYVSAADAERLRTRDRGYNDQLSTLVGTIERRSFEDGNRFDPDLWALDMERFLEHPKLAFLKNRPDIFRTSARDMAQLMST